MTRLRLTPVLECKEKHICYIVITIGALILTIGAPDSTIGVLILTIGAQALRLAEGELCMNPNK